MKKSKILYVLAFGSLLMSCGGTPSSSSTSTSSSQPTTNTPEPTTSVLPGTSSSGDSELTLEKLESVVASAKEKADSIASGTITLDESNSYGDPTHKVMPFEFGKDKNGDVLHYTDFDWNMNPQEMYLMEDEGHTVVAVQKDADGSISKPWETYDKVQYPYRNLLGYNEPTLYGTEGLLEGLVDYVKKNVNKDAKYQLSSGKYELSFGYFTSLDTYDYLVVNSSFSLGESNEVKTLDMEIVSYNQSSFMVDDELKVIQLLDNATASGTKKYKIEQVKGTRSYVNPISLDGFYATSFDLTYNNETLSDDSVVSVEKESNASISLANVLPETANFNFDSIAVSVLEGNEASLNANYQSFSNEISISSSVVGDYKVQVKSKNVTKTFKVKVTEAQPNRINVSYSVDGPQGLTAYSYSGSIQGYVGVEYVLNATVDPFAANQELVASLDGVDTADYQLTKKSIQLNELMPARDMWCFTPLKAGTYDVLLKSAVKDSVQEIVHIVAENAPSLKDVLASDFANKEMSALKYYVTFEPANDGMTGNVKIENRINNQMEQASYTITKGEKFYTFSLTHVSGDEMNLEFKMSFDYTLFLYVAGDNDGKQMAKVTPEFLVSGTWNGTSGDYSLNFTLFENKEASLSMSKSDYSEYKNLSCNFALEAADDGYKGTLTASSYTENPFVDLPLNFTVNKDLTSISISFTYGGNHYSFTLAKSEF